MRDYEIVRQVFLWPLYKWRDTTPLGAVKVGHVSSRYSTKVYLWKRKNRQDKIKQWRRNGNRST